MEKANDDDGGVINVDGTIRIVKNISPNVIVLQIGNQVNTSTLDTLPFASTGQFNIFLFFVFLLFLALFSLTFG